LNGQGIDVGCQGAQQLHHDAAHLILRMMLQGIQRRQHMLHQLLAVEQRSDAENRLLRR
jgi:hypothetical protein